MVKQISTLVHLYVSMKIQSISGRNLLTFGTAIVHSAQTCMTKCQVRVYPGRSLLLVEHSAGVAATDDRLAGFARSVSTSPHKLHP